MIANGQGAGTATIPATDTDDDLLSTRARLWQRVTELASAVRCVQEQVSCAALDAIHAGRVMADVVGDYNELYRDGRAARHQARWLEGYAVPDVGDDEAASFLHSWADATRTMLDEGDVSRRYYAACDLEYATQLSLHELESRLADLRRQYKEALRAARAA